MDKHFLLLVSDESSHHVSIHIFCFSSIVSPPSPNFNVAWFLDSSGRGHFPDKSSHHQTHVFHNIEMGGAGGYDTCSCVFVRVDTCFFFRCLLGWCELLSDTCLIHRCLSFVVPLLNGVHLFLPQVKLLLHLMRNGMFCLLGSGGGDTCMIYHRLDFFAIDLISF